MQTAKMTPVNVERMRRVLTKIADEKSVGEHYGIVDFHYSDIVDSSDGEIRAQSYVSVFLNMLQNSGKIRRIKKGSSAGPSRWDVRQFIHEEPDTSVVEVKEPTQEIEKSEVEVVQAEEQVAPAVLPEVVPVVEATEEKPSKEETLDEIRKSMKQMIDYLQVLPNEMVGHLTTLAKDLDVTDHEQVEKLRTEAEQAKAQVRMLTNQLEDNVKETSRLAFALTLKEKELQDRKEVAVNKHMLIRSRNQILDEIERFIATPGWQKANKADRLRQTINQKLDAMLGEIGIGAEQ